MFAPEKHIFTILREAGPVYAKNLKYLAVATLLAFVPFFLLRLFLPIYYIQAFNELMYTFVATLEAGADTQAISAIYTSPLMQNAANYIMLSFGIFLVFFPLSTSAAIYLADRHIEGETPTFSGMFTAIMPRFPKMVATTAIVAFIMNIMLSFLSGFFLLLAVYFGIGMVFYQHIVADVGRWGLGAISVSRFIIRGRWLRVFFGVATIVALYFASYIILGILPITTGVLSNPFMQLPFFLLQHFALSFFAIAFALWYFDIKRFHKLNFEEIQRHMMDRMRDHMEKYGRRDGDDDDNDDQ